MLNSMTIFTFSVLDQKCPFWENLFQIIKIVCLSWNLGHKIFLVNFRKFSEKLFNEKLRTVVSDFMYVKPWPQFYIALQEGSSYSIFYNVLKLRTTSVQRDITSYKASLLHLFAQCWWTISISRRRSCRSNHRG